MAKKQPAPKPTDGAVVLHAQIDVSKHGLVRALRHSLETAPDKPLELAPHIARQVEQQVTGLVQENIYSQLVIRDKDRRLDRLHAELNEVTSRANAMYTNLTAGQQQLQQELASKHVIAEYTPEPPVVFTEDNAHLAPIAAELRRQLDSLDAGRPRVTPLF